MNYLYAGLLFIAAATSLYAAVHLWKWRGSPGGIPLIAFMASLVVWSLTYAFHWLATDTETRFFWLASTYIGVVFTPVSSFLLTLEFTGRGKLITKTRLILLLIIPILTLIFLATDPLHGLFFGNNPRDVSRIFDGGIWFWINVIFSYSLILGSLVLLTRFWHRSRGIYRKQARLILAALATPVLLNVGGFLGLYPLPEVDMTPLLFTVTGLTIIYALFYAKLFDLVPIAHDRVMQTMNEPFFIIDPQDRIIDLNEAAARMCADFQPDSANSYIGSVITNYFADWQQWLQSPEEQGEFELYPPAYPVHRTFEWRISAVSDRHGKLQGHVMLLNNISRRKMAIQREVELALEKERVTLLKQFIQITAHEIRTPLTAISTGTYLMSRLDDREQRKVKGEQVTRNIERITRVLKMALMMAELENPDMQVNQKIDLPLMLKVVSDAVITKVGNGIRVEHLITAPIPPISGNSSYLNEAFLQLVDNACRYSPPDSCVTIHISSDGERVCVEIVDRGKGISQEQHMLAFQTMWREDAAHTSEGFGIGLSLAKRVIELHQGTIAIESEEGQGTTINVSLPVLLS